MTTPEYTHLAGHLEALRDEAREHEQHEAAAAYQVALDEVVVMRMTQVAMERVR